ncbi:MAG: hypothetical protein J1E78_05200 [Muribaculaceae bacterium]|nr:hypothetical protein [Muribaculaceae bacterium]
MKKVFLSLAVVFSVAMISCGGNKSNEENDSVVIEEAAVIVDPAEEAPEATDSVCDSNAAAEEAPAETPAAAE